MSTNPTIHAFLKDDRPEHAKIDGIGLGDGSLREGIVLDGFRTNRWTNYGHDRVYFVDKAFNTTYDGYIDLETGEIEGETPIVKTEIREVDGICWEYYYASVDNEDKVNPALVVAVKQCQNEC